MREIKFRAWDKATKYMIVTGFHMFGEYTLFQGIQHYLIENKVGKSTFLERMNDVVIEQYTDLKDKSGIEIYEGDYVKILGINWEVVWSEYILGFDIMPYSETMATHEKAKDLFCVDCGDDNDEREEVEVIGNIHENPELLEEK